MSSTPKCYCSPEDKVWNGWSYVSIIWKTSLRTRIEDTVCLSHTKKAKHLLHGVHTKYSLRDKIWDAYIYSSSLLLPRNCLNYWEGHTQMCRVSQFKKYCARMGYHASNAATTALHWWLSSSGKIQKASYNHQLTTELMWIERQSPDQLCRVYTHRFPERYHFAG